MLQSHIITGAGATVVAPTGATGGPSGLGRVGGFGAGSDELAPPAGTNPKAFRYVRDGEGRGGEMLRTVVDGGLVGRAWSRMGVGRREEVAKVGGAGVGGRRGGREVRGLLAKTTGYLE